ncbi:MAG: hypothetical protein JW917_01360 [Ignavibacteria bacterium]|nr:hypothetical protein [Ignavibacteria bacterium]
MSLNPVLLKYFIKLDYRDKDKNTFRKFIGISVSYLISNTFLSLYYYMNFDSMSFAVLSFTFNSFLIVFISMGEYPQLFFAKEQFEIINILPLGLNAFIKSKFISALLYLLTFVLILSLPQSVFFFFFDGNFLSVIAFLLMNLSFTFFLVSVLLIIYSFALKFFSEKATVILFIIQLLFFALIMYSTSIGSRTAELHTDTLMNSKLVNYSPQKFFALGIYEFSYLTAAFFIVLISLYLFLKTLSVYFLEIFETLYFIKPKERKIRKLRIFDAYSDFISDKLVKDNVEKAGYILSKNIITGSKSVLLRYLPLAAAPLIIALIGIITGNESLTFISSSISGNGIPILSPSITMIIIMMSRLFISNLQIADENSNDIQWIYESLPLKSPARIFQGSFKFIYYIFIILPVLLITAMLLIKFAAEVVLINIIYVLIFSSFVMTITFLFIKNYPFTMESTKMNSALRLFDILISVVFAVVIFILQFIIFENYTYIFISIIIIFIINFLIIKQIRNYDCTGKRITADRNKTA